MKDFKIKGLSDYSLDSIIAEIRRVASLIKEDKISQSDFLKHSNLHTSTIRNKFGSWENALKESGLGHRYIGKVITEKVKKQAGKGVENEILLAEIRRVAAKLQKDSITHKDFNNNSRFSSSGIANRFGNWDLALKAAGLNSHIRPMLTEYQLFNNILNVWTYYGRQPTNKEMNIKPSTISGKTYENRFGSWRIALHRFVEFANSSNSINEAEVVSSQLQKPTESIKISSKIKPRQETRRDISLGLRYQVLKRDRFRCVKCGRSPATDIGVTLHIDHIIPFSKNGLTIIDNLQVTCQDCNLGKGNRDTE